MKKVLLLFLILFLVSGCGSNNEETLNKEFTNKYECKREVQLTQYDLDKRDTYSLPTQEDIEIKKNSPVAVNKEQLKIYDFSSDGNKLLQYLDVEKYEYLVDIDMNKEKEYFEKECKNYSKERYESCKVVVENNILTITKVNNLKSDMNKDMANNTTKESITKDYMEDELFTCN